MRLIDADAMELRIIGFEDLTGYRLDVLHDFISAAPTIQSEIKSISFEDYSVALVAMWMDNIVTNEEYKRIMSKVIAYEKAKRQKGREE